MARGESRRKPVLLQVDVRWLHLSQFEECLIDSLDAIEQQRRAVLVREDDRRRFTLGATLLRRVAAEHLRVAPADVEVDRTCPRCAAPHGKSQLPGSGLHASITHAGDLVGVAVSAAAPVGLDVECDTGVFGGLDYLSLSKIVLSAAEPYPRTSSEFLRYWTRKESVVKATGDGLNVNLASVRVSAPDEAPALLAYPGRVLAARVTDLAPRPNYPAALTILTAADIEVVEQLPALPGGEARVLSSKSPATLGRGPLPKPSA